MPIGWQELTRQSTCNFIHKVLSASDLSIHRQQNSMYLLYVFQIKKQTKGKVTGAIGPLNLPNNYTQVGFISGVYNKVIT